mgnify:CR=1 FL=1
MWNNNKLLVPLWKFYHGKDTPSLTHKGKIQGSILHWRLYSPFAPCHCYSEGASEWNNTKGTFFKKLLLRWSCQLSISHTEQLYLPLFFTSLNIDKPSSSEKVDIDEKYLISFHKGQTWLHEQLEERLSFSKTAFPSTKSFSINSFWRPSIFPLVSRSLFKSFFRLCKARLAFSLSANASLSQDTRLIKRRLELGFQSNFILNIQEG